MLTELLTVIYIFFGIFLLLFGIVLPAVSFLLLRSAGVKFDVWLRSLFVLTFLAYASWCATGIVLTTAGARWEIIVAALWLVMVAGSIPWYIIAYKCELFVKYSGDEVVFKYSRRHVVLYTFLFAFMWFLWILMAPIWLVEYSWHRSRRQKGIRKIYAKLEGQPSSRRRKKTWGEAAGGE